MVKPSVQLPEKVFLWYPQVLDDQLRRVGGAYPHFIFGLAYRQTRSAFFHDEGRYPPGLQFWICHRENDKDTCLPPIGTKTFGAIEDIAVLFLHRDGLHIGGIGSCVWFSQRESPYYPTSQQWPQVFLLLVFRAE